jgi:hypothetical protein
MVDQKNHLYFILLPGLVIRSNSLADLNRSSILRRIFDQRSFDQKTRVVQALGVRMKHVQDQAALWEQVIPATSQASKLLLHFEQMLEGPEGDYHQAEFFAYVKLAHVPVHEPDPFLDLSGERSSMLHRSSQHLVRSIKSSNLLTFLGCSKRNATSAASQFKQWLSRNPRFFTIKRDIAEPIANKGRFIVQIGEEAIVE